ncbi:MAG: hypothetical protein II937_04965 [Bacteroidales bacterium]|nr:hypothetical protein [Bacteroidales bacterium]
MKAKALISAIQTHIKDFDGKQVKAFYESDLGFTDVFTEEDNYMDFFKSNLYLESHIKGHEENIETRLKTLNINIEYNQDDAEIKVIIGKLKNINIDTLPIQTDFADRMKIMLEETISMAEHKSYLGVIVFVGSILEAILLGMLKNDFAQTGKLQNDFKDLANNPPKDKHNAVKDFEDWNFNHLLQMAKKVGMYMDKESHKADLIREARNYVHPNEQIKKMNFTLDDALQSVSMLSEIIDSFKRYGKYKIVRD